MGFEAKSSEAWDNWGRPLVHDYILWPGPLRFDSFVDSFRLGAIRHRFDPTDLETLPLVTNVVGHWRVSGFGAIDLLPV